MLPTLRTIGEKLLEGQGVWAQLVAEPKVKDDSDKAQWVCPLLFDCVDRNIALLGDQMQRYYPEESPIVFRYVSTSLWGPRGRKCALTVEPRNFPMMTETFFGKDGKGSQLLEAMVGYDDHLSGSELYNATNEIDVNLRSLATKMDTKELRSAANIGGNEEIVLIYAVIRSEKIRNGSPTPLYLLDGHQAFFVGKFGTPGSTRTGLDYITGSVLEGVDLAQFRGRYNINKIFQTTTMNYASAFTSKNFSMNFQAAPTTIAALDRASSYALHRQTTIAGVPHTILPKLLNKDLPNIDLDDLDLHVRSTNGVLFQAEILSNQIQKQLSGVKLFWLNYIGFESDGNSFKIIHQISDVSSTYLYRLIEVFGEAHTIFRDYIGDKYPFNLGSLYYIIPVRDPKKNKQNEALHIFKDILDRRTIATARIFRNFISLVLCHRYARYKAYPNIRPNDSFDFALKDAVFKYSAFIYILKQLNLTNMAEQHESIEPRPESNATLHEKIEAFFARMSYSSEQKSLFFLGRVLSRVGQAQFMKKYESKPILKKINFNGMDVRAIRRFSNELADKAVQHKIHEQTDWDLSRFYNEFRDHDWPLSPAENVFYIMAGYTFGMTGKAAQKEKSKT